MAELCARLRSTTDPATAALERDWEGWLRTLFPRAFQDVAGAPLPFADHHRAFWAWVWAVAPGVRPRPFVAVWPRGGGKSTNAELAVIALGARGVRRYALYVCRTQDQADDHVQTIAAWLESPAVEARYPDLANRLVGKYGQSRGWRRNRLRTRAGVTVDAMGLDTAARGVKLETQRPDLIVLDDIDRELDSEETVRKLITLITTQLLPAGAPDLAVLAVQNLVHPMSVFSQLAAPAGADRRADFLADRIVSGPHPALRDLAYERREGRTVLVAGVPTWAGQDLARCQLLVDDLGIAAFLAECQHEVTEPDGGMFGQLTFQHCPPEAVPDLVTVVVWCDPAVTASDQSDANGIQVDGVAEDGRIYRLHSWEQRATPVQTIQQALRLAVRYGASEVGVETDQGGLTWGSVVKEAWQQLLEAGEVAPAQPVPRFVTATAGATGQSKAARAALMLKDYEQGRIVHVLGTHAVLERALRRFPAKKPFDLVDAAVWSWRSLTGRSKRLAAPGGAARRSPFRGWTA